jgi:hypothetical protein
MRGITVMSVLALSLAVSVNSYALDKYRIFKLNGTISGDGGCNLIEVVSSGETRAPLMFEGFYNNSDCNAHVGMKKFNTMFTDCKVDHIEGAQEKRVKIDGKWSVLEGQANCETTSDTPPSQWNFSTGGATTYFALKEKPNVKQKDITAFNDYGKADVCKEAKKLRSSDKLIEWMKNVKVNIGVRQSPNGITYEWGSDYVLEIGDKVVFHCKGKDIYYKE